MSVAVTIGVMGFLTTYMLFLNVIRSHKEGNKLKVRLNLLLITLTFTTLYLYYTGMVY